MRKVITFGTFDVIAYRSYKYLKRAKKMGTI